MTLSFSKFDTYGGEGIVWLRCRVCGTSESWGGSVRMDDAVEWMEQHECATTGH
jgi:hypothetical protein